MPRKTDSNNPSDWLFIAGSEVEALRALAAQEIGYSMCRSKLAEVLEKVLKAESLRLGWFLEKTHDLERHRKALRTRDAVFAEPSNLFALAFLKPISPDAILDSTWKTPTGRRCASSSNKRITPT